MLDFKIPQNFTLIPLIPGEPPSTARNLRNGIETENLDNRLIIKVFLRSG